MKKIISVSIVASLLIVLNAFAVDSVVIKGLFKNAALLEIDGERVMLRVGKTKNGIKLLEATSKDALLLIDGKQQRLGLSRQIGGSYQAASKKVLRLRSQEGGHYWARGEINGRSIDFLVDTGASLIAMNLSTAKRLGIDYEAGRPSYVNTANGVTEVRLVTLPKVSVGSITKYNVQASVSLNDALSVTLLGNSFLSRTSMKTENGVLTIEDK